MSDIWDFFKLLLDAKQLVKEGGVWIITLIVYLETGWFFCFFLPGDYLLFLAGLFCVAYLQVNIWFLFTCILSAAILGNFTGYIFGRSVGGAFLDKPDTWYFKKKYVTNTQDFFEKYGGKALIIGRFLPVIRTFAPLFAGIARMNFPLFAIYNVVGGVLWVSFLTLGGYFLGQKFPEIINYVHYIILFFFGITTLTMVKAYFQMRNQKKKEEDAPSPKGE